MEMHFENFDECYSCAVENRGEQNEEDLQKSFECNQCKKWYCSECMEDNKEYTKNKVCDNCNLKTIEIDSRFEKEILEYMHTLIHNVDGQKGLSKMGVFPSKDFSIIKSTHAN